MTHNTKHVRVRLVWTASEDKDDRLDNQILLDLVIDLETRMIFGKFPIFGIYGSPVREDVFPFILKPNGDVDYGKAAEEVGRVRVGRFNLHQRRIAVGEIAAFREDDEEWTYVVVEVIDMVTGRAV